MCFFDNCKPKRSVSLQFCHPQLKVLIHPWKRTGKTAHTLGVYIQWCIIYILTGERFRPFFPLQIYQIFSWKSLTLPNNVSSLWKSDTANIGKLFEKTFHRELLFIFFITMSAHVRYYCKRWRPYENSLSNLVNPFASYVRSSKSEGGHHCGTLARINRYLRNNFITTLR